MKKHMKTAILHISGVIAMLALVIAQVSVSSTCFYLAHQPDVPDGL